MKFSSIPPSVHTVMVQSIDIIAQTTAVIFIARILGADAMGDFVFAFAVAGVLSILLHFGTGEIAIRMYSNDEDDYSAILTGTLTVSAAGSLVCILLATVICVVMDVSPIGSAAVAIAVLAAIINAISMSLNHAILAFASSYRDVPAMLASRTVLLIAVIYGSLRGGLLVAMTGYVASALLLTFLRSLIVRRHLFPPRIILRKRTVATLWRSGSKIGYGAIFGTISGRSDTLLVKFFRTITEVGQWGAANRITMGIGHGSMAVALALFPGLTRALQLNQMTWGRRMFLLFPIVVALTCIALSFWASPTIVRVIYGSEFTPAIPILRILLLTAGLHAIHEFVSKYLVALQKESILPLAKGIAASTNIGLNLWLIPIHGAIGAAVATFASEFVALACFSAAIVRLRRNNRLVFPLPQEERVFEKPGQ